MRAFTIAIAVGVLFFAAPRAQTPSRVQFVFTSDAHYGITRPQFRGRTNVDAHEVNKAMVDAINALPSAMFPADGGVAAAEIIGAFDFLAQTGDIANRMELDHGRQIQTAAASFAQFASDYFDGLTLRTGDGSRTPIFVVPGNHDASNANGFYKPMRPRRDASAMIGIYNRMMTAARPLTAQQFVYPRDRVHYARDINGLHCVFITIWPDSQERAWLEHDLQNIAPTTPILLFAHDQIEGEGKHFSNPTGRHDINATDRFENLLADQYEEGDVDAPGAAEAASLEAFLRRHRNITAYFHGNSNWNEFYDYDGPGHSAAVHVFRVDSPMKGKFSYGDETRLSFQVATIDAPTGRMTVREALWNARRIPSPIVWGSSITVRLQAQ